jgi:DNA-binding transcriptional LysR family regulator
MAAMAQNMKIADSDEIDIGQLVHHPLLLLDASFATRNIFDAACRIAGVRPNVFVESGAVHALLALAEAGHGIAIIPSILRTNPDKVRVISVTQRREPLEIALAVIWDKRRTLPRHAETFSDVLASYMREVFPGASSPRQRKRLTTPSAKHRTRRSSIAPARTPLQH